MTRVLYKTINELRWREDERDTCISIFGNISRK